MDIPTKIPVPDYVYRFYQKAAQNIANRSTEQIMADALSAYAALISDDIMNKNCAEGIRQVQIPSHPDP